MHVPGEHDPLIGGRLYIRGFVLVALSIEFLPCMVILFPKSEITIPSRETRNKRCA